MPKLYLPNNHCVGRDTLLALRSRHVLATSSRQYAPGRYEIGYGNRNGVGPGLSISPCQAEDLLRNDVQYVEAFIRMAVARRISDRAYQALVSFIFDVGPKSDPARERLSRLHEGGEDAFFDGLAGGAEWSRFGEHIGRSARFFEVNHAG